MVLQHWNSETLVFKPALMGRWSAVNDTLASRNFSLHRCFFFIDISKWASTVWTLYNAKLVPPTVRSLFFGCMSWHGRLRMQSGYRFARLGDWMLIRMTHAYSCVKWLHFLTFKSDMNRSSGWFSYLYSTLISVLYRWAVPTHYNHLGGLFPVVVSFPRLACGVLQCGFLAQN